VQRATRDSGGSISLDSLTDLFVKTYGFNVQDSKLVLGEYGMLDQGNGRRRFAGVIKFSGQERQITGEGNGPLSAVLAALHTQIAKGNLSIREYSEHSVGEGTDVVAASFVELVHELPGAIKKNAWGVSTDTDITVSGIKAVLSAASQYDLI
jgi:2-isopropylmalate synthase